MLFIAFQALTFTILVNEGLGCHPLATFETLDFQPAIDYQMDIVAGNIAGAGIAQGIGYVPSNLGIIGRNLPKREVKPFATYYCTFFKVFYHIKDVIVSIVW